MSQFDYPRINFFGEALVNPPTANNNSFLPLVLFDPVKVKAVLPPRIYITKELQGLNGIFPLPEDSSIITDDDGLKYLEISTVNTAKKFKEWVTTPLGQSETDKDFHFIYDKVRTIKGNLPLKGLVPANWNYYGGMEFKFENVKVCSIAIPDDQNGAVYYTSSHLSASADINDLINASVDLRNENGKNTAVMVDVIPSLALYTQIFCDSFTLRKSDNILLRGKPSKASLRFLNTSRIVNQEDSIAGSGTFYCIIPINEIAGTDTSPIVKFFHKYKFPDANITGVFIRFDLFEVKENREVNYSETKAQPNPARCSILGSITPCCSADMRSITMGRQMVPVKPFYQNKNLPPFVCCFDEKRKVLNLDLIGFVPLISKEVESGQYYETYDLGELKISLQVNEDLGIEIGRIHVNEENFSRQKFISGGGIVELAYAHNNQINKKALDEGTLILSVSSENSGNNAQLHDVLMTESEFMITTDQSGIYINQDDDPEDGYVSYSHKKEPCIINIFRKGKPLTAGIPMTVIELRMNSLFSESTGIFLETKEFKNGQTLYFPTTGPANVIYVFYPGDTYKGSKFLIPYILATGFFINLRILPRHNYGRYFDTAHPDYQGPVTFELLYNEILKVYDLIYPSSSIITPFTEEHFKKGWKFIKQRLSPDNWSSFSYMPSSRDMSFDQWQLLCKWAVSVDS